MKRFFSLISIIAILAAVSLTVYYFWNRSQRSDREQEAFKKSLLENLQKISSPSADPNTRIVRGREVKLLGGFNVFETVESGGKRVFGHGFYLSGKDQRFGVGFASFRTVVGQRYLELYDHYGNTVVSPVRILLEPSQSVLVGYLAGDDSELDINQLPTTRKAVALAALEEQLLYHKVVALVEPLSSDSVNDGFESVKVTQIFFKP